MKVSKVTVKNLFGVFNHNIALNTKERITIIHGPNGYGKTIILRMINGLFNNSLSIFFRIPFDSFRIEFDDKNFISIQKAGGERAKLTFTSSMLDEPIPLTRKSINDFGVPLQAIDDIIPELTRMGSQEWRNVRTGEVLNFDEVIERYGELIEARVGIDFSRTTPNRVLKKSIPPIQTHLIKADRLRRNINMETERIFHSSTRRIRGESNSPAVINYSQDLAGRIQQTLAKSVELSSSLDRSFPMRLVDVLGKSRQRKLSDEKIRKELANLEEKRSRLVDTGLLDKEQGEFELPEKEVNEQTRLVLNIYIQDVKKKLAIFDQDLEKFELFKDILSKRFSYKKFKINKNRGFLFTSPDGVDLSPDSLSSGEQHEIVLLYELLFRVKENSLILLDEPEISLHIGWQQEFLKDLAAITQLSEFDVLIATHSPDIIHDRWDLTIGLEGPKK
jgi:predicted ATP-binding protein involved in virulence